MAAADEALTAWAAKIRGLRTLAAEAAKEAAPLVQEAARATARAGTTPDGTPWAPKKDGGRALEHAAEHVTAKALGTVVRIVLTGVDVVHHRGTRRAPKRQVIPDKGGAIPAPIVRAVAEGARRAFARLMGGR